MAAESLSDAVKLAEIAHRWASRWRINTSRIPRVANNPHVDRLLENDTIVPGDSTPDGLSEASVYRLLKAHDLIASSAFIVVKAAVAFNCARHYHQLTTSRMPA